MTIKLHHLLRPAPGAKTEKTAWVAVRGSGGKTAGRGTGGTGPARTCRPVSGRPDADPHAAAEAQGFTNRNRVEYQVVNVGDLAQLFPRAAPSASRTSSPGCSPAERAGQVLGDGELSVKLDITANKFSASARTRSPPPAAPTEL